MLRFVVRRPSVVVAVYAAMVLVAIAVWHGRASAASDAVSGRFTATAVSGVACTSPVSLCATGTLSQGLKGTFTSTASSSTTTADTPTTGVIVVTSDVTISTKSGTIACKDAMALQTTGDDARSSVCAITAGTGVYAGASGYLQFAGTGDGLSGAGTYTGRVTLP